MLLCTMNYYISLRHQTMERVKVILIVIDSEFAYRY